MFSTVAPAVVGCILMLGPSKEGLPRMIDTSANHNAPEAASSPWLPHKAVHACILLVTTGC
jgi:hypothetical protein